MRTAKTDQTGRLPRLSCVFDGLTGHFVRFALWRLIFHLQERTACNKCMMHDSQFNLLQKSPRYRFLQLFFILNTKLIVLLLYGGELHFFVANRLFLKMMQIYIMFRRTVNILIFPGLSTCSCILLVVLLILFLAKKI